MQEVPEEVPVVGVHDRFGQVGEVEEEEVPGLAELPGVVQSLRQLARVGRVQDGQPVHHLGAGHRGGPGDRPAPVVPGQHRGPGAAFADQAGDVGGQLPGVVGVHAVRLGGQVVAAHVGGHHPEPRRRERPDLLPPPVPELGEAVQQHHQRPLPGLDVMQPHITDVGVALTKFAAGAVLGCAH